MTIGFYELKARLAEFFGLNTDHLISFTLEVTPDNPGVVTAIYWTGKINEGEAETLKKEFVVIPKRSKAVEGGAE